MNKFIFVAIVNFISLYAMAEVLPSNSFFLSQDVNDIGVNITCKKSKIKSQIICDLVTYFASNDSLRKCTVKTLAKKFSYKKTKNEGEYIREFVHENVSCAEPVHMIKRDRKANKWTYIINYNAAKKKNGDCPQLKESSLRDVELPEVSPNEFAMKCD